MSLPSPWDCLRTEDMPVDGLQAIASKLGPRVAASVWRAVRGTRLEAPTRFPRQFMVRYIREHWDGTNTAELARALEVHQRTVERLIDAPGSTHKPASEQLSLI